MTILLERRGRAISCPEKVYAVKECDMLICHRPKEAVALTAGQYPTMEHPMAAEKYAKFAYSTVFGYCISRSFHCLEQAGTDSMLTFYAHGMYYVRRKCIAHTVTEQEVYAKWSPVDGIEVETWLAPIEGGHKRRHRIVSQLECEAYECGFLIRIVWNRLFKQRRSTVLQYGMRMEKAA